MAKSLVQLACERLESDKCECGAKKAKRQSFCQRCYFELPPKMRTQLWKSIHDGYAEIWDECCTWLRANTDRMTPQTQEMFTEETNG